MRVNQENASSLPSEHNEEFVQEAYKLKQLILAELEELNSGLKTNNKTTYRNLHYSAVCDRLQRDQVWIKKNFQTYSGYFANGFEVHPDTLKPCLVEVTEQWQSNLFRLARYTWSLPYSSGYGRRIRFLVLDESNNKLIGIIGLQSPPIDFGIRDQLFDYQPGFKVSLVNQMMDIYTLGAIPPYSALLGGKLIALAAASNEVQAAYRRKYEGVVTQIEENVLPSHLIALTTTSAFGRSSIYNRLKYQDRLVAQPIGFTKGYGSFHLIRVYPEIKEFLRKYDQFLGGYGSGPRAVWINCRRTFDLLGIDDDLLKHGVRRETFLFPLIKNLSAYISGQETKPQYFQLSFEELSTWWRERWLLSRAERVRNWQDWDSCILVQQLLLEE